MPCEGKYKTNLKLKIWLGSSCQNIYTEKKDEELFLPYFPLVGWTFPKIGLAYLMSLHIKDGIRQGKTNHWMCLIMN